MDNKQDIALFLLLRKKVAEQFIAQQKGISENIQDWRGQDIVQFQEDLQQKVNTTISEKWFYTYFKTQNLEKLPRIDMLNLLSEYAGYENWLHFSQKNMHDLPKEPNVVSPKQKSKKKYVLGAALLLVLGLFIVLAFPSQKTYQFCFVDKDVNIPITSYLEIVILKEGESPLYLETSENGCFTYETRDKSIQFYVQSPYYKSDTILRNYKAQAAAEKVSLKADEYALILHYFSNNNVEDWNARRTELSKMIHNDAIIYQVFGNEAFGIDVLNKEAFINKITLPTSSLRNMKILEIVKDKGQIIKLKFETQLSYE